MAPNDVIAGAVSSQPWLNGAYLRSDELFNVDLDVATDLTQETRSNVTAGVHWNSRTATVRMAELLMRSSLP